MKTEVKEIEFYGDKLLGVRTEDGQVWLAVRKACRDIGLTDSQARAEVLKMQESLLLRDNCKKLSLKFETQVRETLIIVEKFVPMWLAQINLTPSMQKKNPNAVQKLLKYQLEAAEVLHKAFYESEEQKQKFHESLGIEGEIEDLKDLVINQTKVLIKQSEKLERALTNMTLTTVQQEVIRAAAKDRIGFLLGGAHSQNYKENRQKYFINLWNKVKLVFHCGSRWQDLNPCDLDNVVNYIRSWEYRE